jgi:hypothetical protein
MALAAVLLAASAAPGLINPDFTPLNLVEDAELVLIVTFGKPDKQGRVPTRIVRALVGKAPKAAPLIDVEAGLPAHAKQVAKSIAAHGDKPAVLIVGKSEEGEEAAWLHVGGRWVDLYHEKGVWEVDKINLKMEGTWASGTDMLIRCLEYVAKAPDPQTPVTVGCTWGRALTLGRVSGKRIGLRTVSLAADGTFTLHVLAESGDRLYAWDAAKDAFKDITGQRKLAAKSRAAAWVDLTGDGRLDLATWDGTRLVVQAQGAGGTFSADGAPALPNPPGCIGLAALDTGGGGLLVSTLKRPVLVARRGDRFEAMPLDIGPAPTENLGSPGPCLVADLDGDAVPDLLQPFTEASLFYKGKAPGSFAPGVRIALALGQTPAGACLGDYDADGHLDVFVGAQDYCRLWHNRGGRTFEETRSLSGEIAYIAKPGAANGATCDVNNDGRQDIFILYSKRAPQVFFNRGFRSFGHARELDLERDEFVPDSADGLLAVAVEDLDGDGAQDLAIVLKDGSVRVALRERLAGAGPMTVRAALAPDAPYCGPLTVTAWREDRCLGAWNVVPGTSDAYFGLSEPGQVMLRWVLPGGRRVERKVVAETRPVRVVIGGSER